MGRDSRVFVAGHRGLVGSAILRRLEADGYNQLLTRDRTELDLTDRRAVEAFFAHARPEFVFVAAARVGGILDNATHPADFIRENLRIHVNLVDAAFHHDISKMLVLGSSCIYPRLADQPITEDALLQGPLEPTNAAYAIAKIAGLMMCQAYRQQHGCNFIAAMPTNVYGPGDNFDLERAHVLPALIRRFHEAKERGDSSVTIWGSGTPRREFLHVDDLADACVFLMSTYDGDQHVNVGVGKDISIIELARMIKEIVGFQGSIELDRSKPDGTPRKLLDVTRMDALGWRARIGLPEGIAGTYQWYVTARGRPAG